MHERQQNPGRSELRELRTRHWIESISHSDAAPKSCEFQPLASPTGGSATRARGKAWIAPEGRWIVATGGAQSATADQAQPVENLMDERTRPGRGGGMPTPSRSAAPAGAVGDRENQLWLWHGHPARASRPGRPCHDASRRHVRAPSRSTRKPAVAGGSEGLGRAATASEPRASDMSEPEVGVLGDPPWWAQARDTH